MSRFLRRGLSCLLGFCLLASPVSAAATQGRLLDKNGTALPEDLAIGAYLAACFAEDLAAGHEVRLTLEAALQQAAQTALTEALAGEPYGSGVVVIMDRAGRVLALADQQPAATAASIPLAFALRATPGRTLLPLTALAALAYQEITLDELISDAGDFDLYDKTDPPRCWLEPLQIAYHADQTVVRALENQCDYYFYTAAARLGAERWAKTARLLGLDSLSGCGLPGEVSGLLAAPETLYDPALPVAEQPTVLPAQIQAALVQHLRLVGQNTQVVTDEVALAACADALMRMATELSHADWVRSIREILSRHLAFAPETLMKQDTIGPIYLWLNEIKWGGTQTLEAAVGRSFTKVTPIAMARYWTALANGGYVYPVRLLEGVTAADGSTLKSLAEPTPIVDLSADLAPYLLAVRTGLQGIIDPTGNTARSFLPWPYVGQTSGLVAIGETKDPGQGVVTWLTGWAPNEDPQISVVILLPQGYQAAAAGAIYRAVVAAYMDSAGH